ncbi:MAG: AEC family transporter [Sedimentibacter sp.]|uniref:AEC family transporter n=1 Tax=Sedimentibacter sp. TaxID=1960295 RepID=UPI002980D74E|nr:AEC family transporter [Sedimentibacter sp.]MDW5298577.1 AEC family transporter [Sedimentibacter sp.]
MILGTLINSILLMAIIMVMGYYLRNKGILNDAGEGSLTYILVNITTPAMVINAMNIDFSFDQIKTGAILLAIAIIFDIAMVFLGNIASVKTEDIEKKKMIKYSVALMNGGFMGFPLAYQLYGSQGMFYATMFHTPNIVFMWTYGVSLLLGKKKIKNRFKFMFLNPGMIGVYVGLILYFTQLPLPLFATNLLDLLTDVTTVLSMIIIGSKIATIGVKDSFINKQAYFATFFRLIASPIIMIIIMKFLNFDQMIEQIFVIYAALPVAVLMPILAQKYGGDIELGSKIVVITHLLSLITIPFFFWLYYVI